MNNRQLLNNFDVLTININNLLRVLEKNISEQKTELKLSHIVASYGYSKVIVSLEFIFNNDSYIMEAVYYNMANRPDAMFNLVQIKKVIPLGEDCFTTEYDFDVPEIVIEELLTIINNAAA